MPIMGILKQQKPKWRTSERVDRQYEVFAGYRGEIEEAQRYGYSWCQIGKAVEAEMRELGTWGDDWSVWDVRNVYQALRNKERPFEKGAQA